MSALCQKQTLARFLDILDGEWGCSSSWSIAVKLARRKFLRLTVGATALPVASRFAWAQTYPSRPVRIIVGLAPGGTSDISARLIGQWLSERFGRQFITENKTGAAGSIAAEYVVNAAPDGYTLLVFASAAAVNATLFTISISISSATSRRSGASCGCLMSYWSIHRSRSKPFPS
jgi:tripartite tricarboxylate transporter family receptor